MNATTQHYQELIRETEIDGVRFYLGCQGFTVNRWTLPNIKSDNSYTVTFYYANRVGEMEEITFGFKNGHRYVVSKES